MCITLLIAEQKNNCQQYSFNGNVHAPFVDGSILMATLNAFTNKFLFWHTVHFILIQAINENGAKNTVF